MENQDGKRVARGPGMPRGGKIALAVVLVLVLALAGGYVGLCAYAGSSAFLPNTSIAGVDVSGQSREAAAAALEGALPGLLADSRAEFTCAGQSYAVNGDDPSVSVDAAAAVDAALTDQAGSFFTRGGWYLAAVMHGNRYSVRVTLTGTPDAVTRAVEECSDPEAQTTWEVTDTELVLHKGVTGRTIDVAALTDALAERLGHLVSNDEPASYAPIEAQVTTAPPAAPDFDAIRSEVAAEPADAYLDKETREIVPSVTGVDFDTAQAQAVLDAAGEGETVSVPLLLTEPKLTTAKLEANLFKDVLGSGSTTCAGPSNRWYNIDLAAKRLNGTILLPGETFSYNDTVGPYTLASGYKGAGNVPNGVDGPPAPTRTARAWTPPPAASASSRPTSTGLPSRPIWRLWSATSTSSTAAICPSSAPTPPCGATSWTSASRITPITPSRLSPIWTKTTSSM